jgi:hypothetical protein
MMNLLDQNHWQLCKHLRASTTRANMDAVSKATSANERKPVVCRMAGQIQWS